jgi:YnbE-like lipoprotein
LTKGTGNANRANMKRTALLIVPAMLILPGCVSVKAPDKPIEINLNVTIKQEIIVRLQKDAQDLITSNPELFPK